MSKAWRHDINRWEEEKSFWFITYYKYSIWKNGKSVVKNKWFKIKNPIYQFKAWQPEVKGAWLHKVKGHEKQK